MFNIGPMIVVAEADGVGKCWYGLRRCSTSSLLLRMYAYKRLRPVAIRIALHLEGGEFHSQTLREFLLQHHGVRVGAYTYGECLRPGAFPAGVTLGRYCSVAKEVRVHLRNHPMDRLSTHPFFYNKLLGLTDEDLVRHGTLSIGDDVWLGERATITPGCQRIGLGAVVGAGSVVTKDVPDFAVVAGNPARLIRFRFPEPLQELVRQSRWWERSMAELMQYISAFKDPVATSTAKHPLLRSAPRASGSQLGTEA